MVVLKLSRPNKLYTCFHPTFLCTTPRYTAATARGTRGNRRGKAVPQRGPLAQTPRGACCAKRCWWMHGVIRHAGAWWEERGASACARARSQVRGGHWELTAVPIVIPVRF